MIEPEDPKVRILEVATRLFAARGFDGVSIQAVAEAVGMRGPSVLYHYRTKELLRDAVLAKLLGHWKDDLPRVLAAAQSGGDRLDGALRAMLGFFGDDPDRARLLLRELLVHEQCRRVAAPPHHVRACALVLGVAWDLPVLHGPPGAVG